MFKCTEIHFDGAEQSTQTIVQITCNPRPLCFLAIDHTLHTDYLLLIFKKGNLLLLYLFFFFSNGLPVFRIAV